MTKYKFPTNSFLKNIAYVRSSLMDEFPYIEGTIHISHKYNEEIRLAGNSISTISEILSKYLKILNTGEIPEDMQLVLGLIKPEPIKKSRKKKKTDD